MFTPQLRKLNIGAPFGTTASAAYTKLCELGHTHSNESKIIEVARTQLAG